MLSSHAANGSEAEILHHHHTATAASQTGHNSTGNGNGSSNDGSSSRRGGNINSAAPSCGTAPRCKSALSYQQQLANVAADSIFNDAGGCYEPGSGRYSPHPNEMYLHHHGKLSMQPIDRYDDALACCLPPPSPAPNSDRFIMGLMPPSGSVGCGVNANGGASSAQPGPASNLLHMHQPYGSNYDCAKKQHHQQSLSSSTSTSSLSTNSGGGGAGNMSHKYVTTMQQCSISPNTRVRMSDRFREVPAPKPLVTDGGAATASTYANATPHTQARHVASSHFLTQSTPLVSNDTYLSSTVHTPVKRYVPTPPPPNEFYPDISMPTPPSAPAPSKCGSKPASNATNGAGGHNTPQHVNTLPYRFRMKCCANGEGVPPLVMSQQQQQQPLPTSTSHLPHYMEHRSLSVTDYYATSPRNRSRYTVSSGSSGGGGAGVCNNSSKCTTSSKDSSIIILHEQQLQMVGAGLTAIKSVNNSSGASTTSSCLSSDSSNASSSASPMTIGGRLNAPKAPRATVACMLSDYVSRTPSIEYINTAGANNGGARIFTPVTAVTTLTLDANSAGANSAAANGSSGNAATCLHCNTVRRTTGVHQTTQTTGPISPIPLPQLMGNNSQHCLGGLPQNTRDQAAATLTHSSSESYISPLSPAATAPSPRSEQQKQPAEPQPLTFAGQKPQSQTVATPGTITEHVEATASLCGQQQQQQQPAAVGGRALTLQHCQMPLQPQTKQQQQLPFQQQQQQQRYSRKKRLTEYLCKEISRFFGVDANTEAEESALWQSRQRRLALRRFGAYKSESELQAELNNTYGVEAISRLNRCSTNGGDVNQHYHHHHHHHHTSERPDILPAQDAEDDELGHTGGRRRHFLNADFHERDHVERKASVATMLMSSLTFIVHTLKKRQPRHYRQWSRSFAPAHVNHANGLGNPSDLCEGLTALQEEEVFFDTPGSEQAAATSSTNSAAQSVIQQAGGAAASSALRVNSIAACSVSGGGLKMIEHQRQIYVGERMHGWRTSAIMGPQTQSEQVAATQSTSQQQSSLFDGAANSQQKQPTLPEAASAAPLQLPGNSARGNRISAQLLDGVLENSRRPAQSSVKLFSVNDLDDRTDHRPFFTYWINTVQILVLCLSLICYGVGPIGIGVEQKTGQVLVTSLSLQTVQHIEQRNVWIGPRNNDLVHMGAKFATCMRTDVRIMDVLLKTRRQERETACCIRNDDSGCVQSSQADCSVRGLFPTKSISTWKKWSPGESGPGGRISGSVCGLDPKYCDAPASIAPYEWPDDITKWPICRKTNSFSQRFRYKDHTAEHMVCEVIGHPCCTGVYGECRITTREYCDFVNGYFHEEASLCSQISCLNNVCGMFPFFSIEVPDQFYRLLTSLCLHAGILHLAITITFQHIFLADLERLIGPIRAAVVYIGSGLAGNLTSAVLVPYKPEVGPLASLCGVVASLVVLLILIHWKHLRKPHIALFKLILLVALLFGIGTLPWQLNFAGLLAGIFCGIFLTIALVPFVSVNKYGRKSKINLIWTCIIFHLFTYSILLAIFYVFPTELTSLNVGEFLSNGFNSNLGGIGSGLGGVGVGGDGDTVGIGIGGGNMVGDSDVLSSTKDIGSNGDGAKTQLAAHHTSLKQPQLQQQKQYYYQHYSDDIIANAVAYGEDSKMAHFLQSPTQSQTETMSAAAYYHRVYHMNRNNNKNNIGNKFKYSGSIITNNNSYYSNTNLEKYLNGSNTGRLGGNSNCDIDKLQQGSSSNNCSRHAQNDEAESKTENNKHNNNNFSIILVDKNNNNRNSIKNQLRHYGGYQKNSNFNTNNGSSSHNGGHFSKGNDTLRHNKNDGEEVMYMVEADTDAGVTEPGGTIQQQHQNKAIASTAPTLSSNIIAAATAAAEHNGSSKRTTAINQPSSKQNSINQYTRSNMKSDSTEHNIHKANNKNLNSETESNISSSCNDNIDSSSMVITAAATNGAMATAATG